MCLAWGPKAPSHIVRKLLSWRVAILNDCEPFVVNLKKTLQFFRDTAMGKTLEDPPYRWFFPENLTREEMIEISLVSRALPAPIRTGDYLRPLVERWTSEPAPFPDDFRDWISSWVRFNKPYFQENSWPFSPSLSACLEFSRSSGGLSTAMSKLTMMKLSVLDQKWFDEEMKLCKTHCLIEKDDISPYQSSMYLVAACVSCVRPLFNHCKSCRGGCNQSELHPTMAAIAVKERGWKVRVPTMLQAPLVILAKVLRTIAESYLRSDPRIRPSLEGRTEFPPNKRGLRWRSQDLTTATDAHNPEVNRHFYREITKEMHRRPPWMDDVIDVVCGYYSIISKAKMTLIRQSVSDRPVPPPSEKFRRMLGEMYVDYQFPTGELMFEQYETGLSQSAHAIVSTNGQPMGLPTSWPLLPIYTLYAYERSRKGSLVTIQRFIVKRSPDSFDFGTYSKILGGQKYPRTKLSREVPRAWKMIQTTGDDAVFPTSKKESELHTDILLSLGQSPSKTKDYFSDFGVYTEVFVSPQGKLDVCSAGTLLAPKAVRSPTWYNQGQSRAGAKTWFSLWGSPFLGLYKHLRAMGCPVDQDATLGGLQINIGSTVLSRQRLAFRLANKSIEELLKIDGESLRIPLPEEYPVLGTGKVPLEFSQARAAGRGQELLPSYRHELVGGKVNSKALATRSLPSPLVKISLKEWDAYRYQMKTWDQLVFPPKPPRALSVYEYIVNSRSGNLRDDHKEVIEESLADLRMEVGIPWGAISSRNFCLGFTRPSTPVPILILKMGEGLTRTVGFSEALLDPE